jgi:hypothetical protein
LLAAFGINSFISYVKDEFEERLEDDYGENTRFYIFMGMINLTKGIIVSAINLALSKFIRLLTSIEKNTSHTRHHLSVMVKLVIAMYINTAIIPLIVNWNVDKWFSSSGLISDVFFNTLSV